MNLIADEDDMLNEMARSLLLEQLVWIGDQDDWNCGCLLKPGFAHSAIPLQRRAVMMLLQRALGAGARIETRSVEAFLSAFSEAGPIGGYTANVQGDLALSANKKGLRIETMSAYRARRKKN